MNRISNSFKIGNVNSEYKIWFFCNMIVGWLLEIILFNFLFKEFVNFGNLR